MFIFSIFGVLLSVGVGLVSAIFSLGKMILAMTVSGILILIIVVFLLTGCGTTVAQVTKPASPPSPTAKYLDIPYATGTPLPNRTQQGTIEAFAPTVIASVHQELSPIERLTLLELQLGILRQSLEVQQDTLDLLTNRVDKELTRRGTLASRNERRILEYHGEISRVR